MTPEMLVALSGTPDSGLCPLEERRPEWLAEDAALASSGVPRREWLAARVRWAGDQSAVPELNNYLLAWAAGEAEAQAWPRRVDGKRWLVRLVALAVFEEMHAAHFARARDWHTFMDVSPTMWREQLEEPYQALRAKLSRWARGCRKKMRRRMREG